MGHSLLQHHAENPYSPSDWGTISDGSKRRSLTERTSVKIGFGCKVWGVSQQFGQNNLKWVIGLDGTEAILPKF